MRLTELGHRRIALLNGPKAYTFAQLRQAGFEAAMRQHQVPVDPAWVVNGYLTESSGHAMTQQMLGLPQRPTALLCATDAMAIGAMAACRQAGLRVGTDVSIIGYGNSESARFSDPPLTTVEHRVHENGQHIGQLMLDILGGVTPEPSHYLEPVELVPRSSDGPCPTPSASP